jgi:ergothioneine biosynthesis protein EgtB
LQPYALSNRLVTNAEFQEFIEDDGYQTPSLWLSDGWSAVRTLGWNAPMYWLEDGQEFTLSGVRRRQPKQAVRHVSFFEAAAFALWSGARLPTEFEWEVALQGASPPSQAFGVAWQWTRSSYDPYPRYQPPCGPTGEYNGKFMVGQLVLRGSSFATSPGHGRPTYRNYFPPSTRWQFSGIRLARDL